MNTTKIACISIVFMLSLSSCSNKILPEKMPTTQIIFGSGGGFTNQIKEYSLLENGKIVEKATDGTHFNVITTVEQDKAEQCFNICKSFKLDELKFNEPGNMYYFLTIRSHAKEDNHIVWGDRSKPIAPEVATLHKMLMSYLPKKSPQDSPKK